MKLYLVLTILVCVGLFECCVAFGFKKKFGKFGGGPEFYGPVSVLPVPVPIHEHVHPQYVPVPLPIIIQQPTFPAYTGAIATASASASASAGSSFWPSSGWSIGNTGWEGSTGWGNGFPSLGVGFSKYGGFFKR